MNVRPFLRLCSLLGAGAVLHAQPSITLQPADAAVEAGQPAAFRVDASGNPAPTYQWRKNGSAISGATAYAYAIAKTLAADAGSYSVVVTNSGGSVASAAASLTVSPASVAATHAVVGSGYVAGGTVTITNTITYTGAAKTMGWRVAIPFGWSYASGTNDGSTKPAAGTTKSLEWSWTTAPASPITFTYTLNVPAGATEDYRLPAAFTLRRSSGPVPVYAEPVLLIVRRAP